MSHTCLYSPAAERHRTLAGTVLVTGPHQWTVQVATENISIWELVDNSALRMYACLFIWTLEIFLQTKVTCWLDVRKSIRLVKIEWWGAGMVICLHGAGDFVLTWLSVCKVQKISIWSSWWHCHLIISWFIKIQNGLTFLVSSYQVVVEKRLSNGGLSFVGWTC